MSPNASATSIISLLLAASKYSLFSSSIKLNLKEFLSLPKFANGELL